MPAGGKRQHRSLGWTLLLALALTLSACGSQSDATDTRPGGSGNNNHCHVQLFDDAGFTGENVFLRGAGEYPDLDQLPDGSAHWSGRAGSFKIGSRAVVTFWSQPGFEGDATTWSGRTAEPAVAPPRSLKISCKKETPPED